MTKPVLPGTNTAPAAAGPSREARRRAAVLLEVLAGIRTTTDAAAALGLSLVRYYQLEAQALRGLLAACEPRPKGRGPSADTRLAVLQKEQQRLQRELARQQSLVRLSQRALGLPPPPTGGGKAAAPGKRKRRPSNRALRMAERLLQDENSGDEGPAGASAPAEGR